MNNARNIIGITLLSFTVYYFLNLFYFYLIRDWFNSVIHQFSLSHIITYILLGLPLFVGACLIHSKCKVWESLGLSKSIAQGVVVAFVFTLPMFVGYAYYFNFNADVTVNRLVVSVGAAALFEELYFRAFLFGMLYRYTKIGFLPAIVFGAILFACGHLYQSQELAIIIGVFITTFMGAMFFAWLYCEWRFNLWVPVFMHLFMNLSWLLYDVSDNALGDQIANVFRVTTIVFAIIFTILYKKYQGHHFEITRRTIWIK